MSFATEVLKSSSALRTLIEIDVAIPNTQWVNIGAGVWYVGSDASYDYVDDSFWGSSAVLNFGAIGSVRVDGAPLDKQAALSDLTNTPNTFYYDAANADLYVCIEDLDDPAEHLVRIGVIYGYSTIGFRPTGGPGLYEGRVTQLPTITAQRDPMFYGREVFNVSGFRLHNGDGEFDSFGEDNDIYGNEARVLIGFEDINYANYVTVFTGYIQTFRVSETEAVFTVADKRKQLTKPVQLTATAHTNINALDAIADILNDAYGYSFDARYFDLTGWAAAKAALPAARADVTINMQEPEPVIDVIEDIASSVFGMFLLDADNKFTFKIVDTTASAETTIQALDVLNLHDVTYDPTEVISSVRIGYARDWTVNGSSAYTYYTDTTSETSVFNTYKTYNQKTLLTLLPNLTAATAYATAVLDYFDAVHGRESITVPLTYYTQEIGDIIEVVVQRGDQAMIGTMKCEVVGVRQQFETPTTGLDIRYIASA